MWGQKNSKRSNEKTYTEERKEMKSWVGFEEQGAKSQGSHTYFTSEPSLLLVDQYELEEKIFQMTNSSCW